MRRFLPLLLSLVVISFALQAGAQTEPDSDNLKHFWNFESGSPTDMIGDANGTLKNDASIADGKLMLISDEAAGPYLDIPGDVIEINTYPELTLEVWCTPVPASNDGPNMTLYFGSTSAGGVGIKHVFYSTGRWGNAPRAGISTRHQTAGYLSEEGITGGSEYGDSTLRHHVITIKDTMMYLYIDGIQVGLDTFDLDSTRLDLLSNDSVFFGKAGYTSDPTWKGSIELVGLWNKALSADEVQWLYDQGEKRAAPSKINSTKQINANLNGIALNYKANRLTYFMVGSEFEGLPNLAIYNTNGSIVHQQQNFENGSEVNLKPGIYLVRLFTGSQTTTGKILVW